MSGRTGSYISCGVRVNNDVGHCKHRARFFVYNIPMCCCHALHEMPDIKTLSGKPIDRIMLYQYKEGKIEI